MLITIVIQDEELLTDDERDRLKALFKDTGGGEYEEAIGKIVHAALAEYKDMLLEPGMPRATDEIRRRRLLHLIKHYFGVRLPSEEEVALVFQQTPASSETLIRSLIHNPHHELTREVRATLAKTMCQCWRTGNTGPYRVIIQSANVLEELKRIVCLVAPDANQIAKVRYSASTYSVYESTYQAILRYLLREPLDDAVYVQAKNVYQVTTGFDCMLDELVSVAKQLKVRQHLQVVNQNAGVCELSKAAWEKIGDKLRA
jgi:hypothetical protein